MKKKKLAKKVSPKKKFKKIKFSKKLANSKKLKKLLESIVALEIISLEIFITIFILHLHFFGSILSDIFRQETFIECCGGCAKIRLVVGF